MRQQLTFLNLLVNKHNMQVTVGTRDFFELAFPDEIMEDFRFYIYLNGLPWKVELATPNHDYSSFVPFDEEKDHAHPLFALRHRMVDRMEDALDYFNKAYAELSAYCKKAAPFPYPFMVKDVAQDITARFTSHLQGNHMIQALHNDIDDDKHHFLKEMGYRRSKHYLPVHIDRALNQAFASFCATVRKAQRDGRNTTRIYDQINDIFANLNEENRQIIEHADTFATISAVKSSLAVARQATMVNVLIFCDQIERHFPFVSPSLDATLTQITKTCNGLSHVRAKILRSKSRPAHLSLSFFAQQCDLNEGQCFTPNARFWLPPNRDRHRQPLRMSL